MDPDGTAAPAPYDAVAVNIDPTADNRIHADDVAQQLGFAGALVPGVELFAVVSAPLVRAWGEDFLARGRLQVRFRRPVYDGERITVRTAPRDGAFDVALEGPDGTARTVGVAHAPAPQEPPRDYAEAPLPDELRDAPTVGPFGTVVERGEPGASSSYARALGDDSSLYERVVHPGCCCGS